MEKKEEMVVKVEDGSCYSSCSSSAGLNNSALFSGSTSSGVFDFSEVGGDEKTISSSLGFMELLGVQHDYYNYNTANNTHFHHPFHYYQQQQQACVNNTTTTTTTDDPVIKNKNNNKKKKSGGKEEEYCGGDDEVVVMMPPPPPPPAPATPNSSSSISSASSHDEHHSTSTTLSSQQPHAHHNHRTTDKQLKVVKKRSSSKQKKEREARFAFMTKSEVDHLEDGYRWRKYGQKAVKNSPFPRSYYRCTTASCNVKKRVERSLTDPTVVVTTYQGQHTHPSPLMPRPPPPPFFLHY